MLSSFIIAIRWINHDNKLVIDAECLEHKLLNYVTSTADGESSPGHHQQQRQQLQLATLPNYGTNDRQREPPAMILHMSVKSMMVCILSKDTQRS
ncbi:MAG TPA: hypothetical protein VIW25_09975 [Nitrososphaeraceae archaeon]